MIILHACVYYDKLYIWGESSESVRTSSTSKSRKRQYPFSASSKDLVSALNKVPLGIRLTKHQIRNATVWLPTKGNDPVPSSNIIAEMPISNTKPKVVPWTVPSYSLPIPNAVLILSASVGMQTLADDVLIGADLAYWAEALRFTRLLIKQQKFLPNIIPNGIAHMATWLPVFMDKDAERFAKLARLMPAACRALSESSKTTPPDISSVTVLEMFIYIMADHLIRIAIHKRSTQSNRRPRKNFDNIHDSWIYAIKSRNNIIRGTPEDLDQLIMRVNEWQRPIMISANSPFRLCFRLEEPKNNQKTSSPAWYVRYLLQLRNDPSLLIPADAIWNGDTKKIFALKKSGTANAREFLIFSLKQASGICSDIITSLKNANLAGYAIDTDGAYQFLSNDAVALEQAGYGVMLPAWARQEKAPFSTQAVIKNSPMIASNGLTMSTLLKFDWEVALGDQKVTASELQNLVKIKLPLVRIRGQWVEVNAKEIRMVLKLLKKGTVKTTFRDVIQMTLGVKGTPNGLEFEGVRSTGQIAQVIDRLNGKVEFKNLKPPKGFSGTLRPYQLRGLSWLSFLQECGLGGCLADDMGLGKTIQILALVQQQWQAGKKHPVLLICPTSVMSNWQREALRFTPKLPVMIHHGVDRKTYAAFKKDAKKHAMVISSYGLMQRDIKSLNTMPWSGIVLDEAQNIKNYNTKQAQSARTLKADYYFALTGTPVENNVGDLWSIMEFLNPGFLGSQKEFKQNFFKPIQTNQDPKAAKMLKRATGPLILRRLKTDKSIISDLPKKMESKIFCTLTKEQASLYATILDGSTKVLYKTHGIQRKGIILTTLLKLKQVCNHPVNFLNDNTSVAGRSGKLARLTEMLEEVIESGDKALIFSQFVGMGHILKRHIQDTFGREALFLHGSVPAKQRSTMVDRFQSDDGPPVFVLSIKAGGTGLNLTSANHVFHFDRWWNPAVENQATDRAFRIGQKRNVQVHKFVCAGTLEEKIDEMIEHKRNVAEKVVGTGEKWLTELSNEDLMDVLTLSKEAVGV